MRGCQRVDPIGQHLSGGWVAQVVEREDTCSDWVLLRCLLDQTGVPGSADLLGTPSELVCKAVNRRHRIHLWTRLAWGTI